MNITTHGGTTDASDKQPSVVTIGSKELLSRIATLETECQEISIELVRRGQVVASFKMDDAITGLHKTQSVWNQGIEW